jgi:hypothetical protein
MGISDHRALFCMEDLTEIITTLIQPWHEQRGEMRERAVHWIRSAAFRDVFYDDAHPPLAAEVLLGHTMKRSEAAMLRKNARIFGQQTPELWKQYQDLADSGVLIFGHVIIANPGCASQPHRNLPCLVLVTEDQSPRAVAEAMQAAERLGELYTGERNGEPALTILLRDDGFQLFRRRTLPLCPLLRGEAHLLDLALRFSWLPPDGRPFVPLMIQPGGKGAAVQIPWSIVADWMPDPESMKRGIWGELADLDREADRHVARQNAKRGCRFWVHRVCSWIFFLGLGLGLIQVIMEKIRPSPAAAPGTSRDAPSAKSILWEQPLSVRQQFTAVPGSSYEPLRIPGNNGYGFVFLMPGGLVAAVTPRQGGRQAPEELWRQGLPHLKLDVLKLQARSDSWMQMVTGAEGGTQALEFNPEEVLTPGVELWVVYGKGLHVSGKLLSLSRHSLNAPSKRLQLRLDEPEPSLVLSGCPVVHAGTGHVVGVLSGKAASSGAAILLFETISLLSSNP